MVEVVGIFVAARNGKDARTQDDGDTVRHQQRIARVSEISDASLSAMPNVFSNAASNMTPPSEVMRPPSNAAVIFLRATAGKLNGSRVSSSMAGVAASDWWKLASTPNLCLKSDAYATSASESLLCAE